jgi:N-acetylornithine carbamoyltransferase
MPKRDFLAVEDWSYDDIDALLLLAARVKRGDVSGGLTGLTLAALFLDPSLRTRASFDAAMALHGGHTLVLEPGRGAWPLELEPGAVMDGATVEHAVDAARVLGRYADFLAVRCFPRGNSWQEARRDDVLQLFAKHCEKPVINLESARRHPCQELADMQTIVEKVGRTQGKKFALTWSWHPKALPTAVPASAALAAARLGMDLTIARPDGYDLDSDDMATIQRIAEERGGSVATTDDINDAATGAVVVYAKSWGALGDFGNPEREAERRAGLRHWRVSSSLMKHTQDSAGAFMHCLPVRRNVEVDDAVIDGPWSAVVDQAENRLHAQRALLLTMAREARR